MAEVVPVAELLGLKCPRCGTQLEDAIGPFWCPSCEEPVSAWHFVVAMGKALHDLMADSAGDHAPDGDGGP